MELSSLKNKTFQKVTFQAEKNKRKKHSGKVPYISGNGTF